MHARLVKAVRAEEVDEVCCGFELWSAWNEAMLKFGRRFALKVQDGFGRVLQDEPVSKLDDRNHEVTDERQYFFMETGLVGEALFDLEAGFADESAHFAGEG